MIEAPKDMAVVVCYFNYHNFDSLPRNLRRFCRSMQQLGAPLFGMELRAPGRPSEVKGLHGSWTSVQGNNRTLLWQKEAMWNHVASHLPREYTKVFCCDADLWFDNPNFLQETADALDTHKVVMPYSTAVWTDARGAEVRTLPDSQTAFRTHGSCWEGHPGFATAFQRSLWTKKINLYHQSVTGAGDCVLWDALAGEGQRKDRIHTVIGGDGMLECHHGWKSRIRDFLRRRPVGAPLTGTCSQFAAPMPDT